MSLIIYDIIKILIITFAIGGIFYTIKISNRYNKDTSTKEVIISLFKEHNAIDLESGIKIKDLPNNISKSLYLLMMVKDNTLIFKKGKYYLNEKLK